MEFGFWFIIFHLHIISGHKSIYYALKIDESYTKSTKTDGEIFNLQKISQFFICSLNIINFLINHIVNILTWSIIIGETFALFVMMLMSAMPSTIRQMNTNKNGMGSVTLL